MSPPLARRFTPACFLRLGRAKRPLAEVPLATATMARGSKSHGIEKPMAGRRISNEPCNHGSYHNADRNVSHVSILPQRASRHWRPYFPGYVGAFTYERGVSVDLTGKP